MTVLSIEERRLIEEYREWRRSARTGWLKISFQAGEPRRVVREDDTAFNIDSQTVEELRCPSCSGPFEATSDHMTKLFCRPCDRTWSYFDVVRRARPR